jgi:hypothetical protein
MHDNTLYLLTNLSHGFELLSRRKIWRNNFFGAYLAADSGPTLLCLYGKLPFLRNWITIRYGLRMLQSYLYSLFPDHARLCHVLDLPGQPVIYSSVKDVAVVVSGAERTVLKLMNGPQAAVSVRTARLAWEAFASANMQQHVPTLIDSGLISDSGVHYIKTSLVPNACPLFRSFKGRSWPDVLQRRILPIVQKFHIRNGFALLTGSTWAGHISRKYQSRFLPIDVKASLNSSLSRIALVDSYIMPIGLISADLQPQNVHFSRDKVVFLDWSNTLDASLLIDVICDLFYRAMSSPDSAESIAYWDFVCQRSDLSTSTAKLRRFYAVWNDWMSSWFQLSFHPDIFRLQLEGIFWDWLGTMDHLWLSDGTLLKQTRFPSGFLEYCSS